MSGEERNIEVCVYVAFLLLVYTRGNILHLICAGLVACRYHMVPRGEATLFLRRVESLAFGPRDGSNKRVRGPQCEGAFSSAS